MKNERPPMTQKEYRKFLSFLLPLGVASVGLITVAVVLTEKDFGTKVFLPIGGVGLALFIPFMALFVKNFSRVMNYTGERSVKGIKKKEHLILSGVTKEGLISACRDMGFEEKDVYLHKRSCSLATDYVNYFVRFVDVTDGVKHVVKSEIEKINAYQYQNKNGCLLLFLFSDDGKKEDLDYLKEFSARVVVTEKTLRYSQRVWRYNTTTIVLVDNQTQKGYIETDSQFGALLYNKGVKLAQKLAKAKNESTK